MALTVVVLMALSGMALITGPAGAEDRQAATITVDTDVTFQTITSWEATAWMGQDSSEHFANYSADVLDMAVDDLGINRLRLEVRAGAENAVDYWTQYQEGIVDYTFWREHRYTTVNDDADPDHINWTGFQFSELDATVEMVVLPWMQRVTAAGGTPLVNLNYVAFTGQNGAGLPYIHHSADEYAEFMLATFIHLEGNYSLVPDYLEIILEPDNVAQWTGYTIGNAIVATKAKLAANGFTPMFIAPSNTNMGGAVTYFDQITTVSGAVDSLAELSYHRYGGVSDTNLQSLSHRGEQYGLDTAMLEHIGSGYDDLHKDLTMGNCSSWQQFTLAGFGPGDTGGAYMLVDLTDPANPVTTPASRTKFLWQYFHYIEPGAVRVLAETTEAGYDPVAFLNPDGGLVVMVKASAAGYVTMADLAPGSYGISYTTASQYARSLPNATVGVTGTLQAYMPAAGVMTIYEIRRAPTFTPSPAQADQEMHEDMEAYFSVTPINYDRDEVAFEWRLDGVVVEGVEPSGYTYVADYDSAGDHELTVTVSDLLDPTLKTSFTWYISVLDVNRAPTLSNFDPVDATPSVEETAGGSMEFSLTGVDPDGDTLTYTWYVDSAYADSGVGRDLFTYQFDFDSSGYHQISVSVTDGVDTITHSWTLQVINVNRPPTLVSHSPVEQEMSVNETSYGYLYLSINVFDPDGDYLSYEWTQNEVVQYGSRSASFTFRYNHESAGDYVVRVTASDSTGSVSYAWLIEVVDVNVPPSISSANPYYRLYYYEQENGTIDMSVSASDPEGDVLTYKWYVDDVLMPSSNESAFTFRYGYESEGTHYVNVSVSDGEDEATYTWTVYIYNTNRRPWVRGASPNKDPTVDDTSKLRLTVDAVDPDAGDERRAALLLVHERLLPRGRQPVLVRVHNRAQLHGQLHVPRAHLRRRQRLHPVHVERHRQAHGGGQVRAPHLGLGGHHPRGDAGHLRRPGVDRVRPRAQAAAHGRSPVPSVRPRPD